MEMIDLLSFDIDENNIEATGTHYYAFRINPPNFATLDESEKVAYRKSFENILRATEDINFNIYAMDKTVNLDGNRRYINTFGEQFDFIKQSLLEAISDTEANERNTEKAYYLIVATNNLDTLQNIEHLLRANNFNAPLAKYDELVSILRCFFLREFIDQSIYQTEEEN